MPIAHLRLAPCLYLLLIACGRSQAPEDRYVQPQWRLQPSSQPSAPAADTAPAAEVAATAPSADATAQAAGQQAAVLKDALRDALRTPDPARAIDPEAARAAARAVPGVRSVVWVDEVNLLALVDSNARRNHQTIDEICFQLAPLGDTSGVMVNLQSNAARNADELAILSRGCQLVPGERTIAQGQRQIDVLPAEVRAQYRAGQSATDSDRKRTRSKGDEAALRAIPEM